MKTPLEIQLEQENLSLKTQITVLKDENSQLRAENETLKQKAEHFQSEYFKAARPDRRIFPGTAESN